MSVYTLTSPDLMQAVGIASSADSVRLSLSNCVRPQAELTPLPLVRSDEPVEAWWDLSPRFPSPPADWVHALSGSPRWVPLYLRSYASYWFEHLPETRMLYFQYNRSEDAAGEATARSASGWCRKFGGRGRKPLYSTCASTRVAISSYPPL